MAAIARTLAAHYKEVDLDLLLTGVLLHDLGKIEELTWDRSFGYSTEGQLLGHIHIGVGMVEDKLRRLPGFPARLRTLLTHMILSHHGHLEYGSPKLPQFPEALLLHHIDNLDSRMECMRAGIARDQQMEGYWTGYNSALERSFLKKAKYLEEPAERPAAAATTQAAAPVPSTPASHPVVNTPPAPRPVPANPSTSVMAEKLRNALGGNSGGGGSH